MTAISFLLSEKQIRIGPKNYWRMLMNYIQRADLTSDLIKDKDGWQILIFLDEKELKEPADLCKLAPMNMVKALVNNRYPKSRKNHNWKHNEINMLK